MSMTKKKKGSEKKQKPRGKTRGSGNWQGKGKMMKMRRKQRKKGREGVRVGRTRRGKKLSESTPRKKRKRYGKESWPLQLVISPVKTLGHLRLRRLKAQLTLLTLRNRKVLIFWKARKKSTKKHTKIRSTDSLYCFSNALSSSTRN